ncbi:Endoribonuclease MazF9 [Chlamydiales bacterium SCGC AG-110-M15]|nr:Endoribonuclease MazF9 [Chlamydiales bacterium SCGC AG-110-M15]
MIERVERGEVWLYDPEQSFGKEMGRNPSSNYRLCIVVSNDTFNNGPSGLLVIVPCTTKDKGRPSQVLITKIDGGVKKMCFALPEHIHSVDKNRLCSKWGNIKNPDVIKDISGWLADILDLEYFGFQ